MEAKISELWDTGIEILDIDEKPLSHINDLKKIDNITIIDKDWIQLDGQDYEIFFSKMSHPSGGGTCLICKILPI